MNHVFAPTAELRQNTMPMTRQTPVKNMIIMAVLPVQDMNHMAALRPGPEAAHAPGLLPAEIKARKIFPEIFR